MSVKKFSTAELLDHFLAYIRQNGSPAGMKANAAKHFGCDRRTITRHLESLRRGREIGRDVYRRWRDSQD